MLLWSSTSGTYLHSEECVTIKQMHVELALFATIIIDKYDEPIPFYLLWTARGVWASSLVGIRIDILSDRTVAFLHLYACLVLTVIMSI